MSNPKNLEILSIAAMISAAAIKKGEGLYSLVKGGYVGGKDSTPASTIIHAYNDNAKPPVPTIGWGTTMYPNGKAVKMGDSITKKYADELLIWENMQKCIAVNKVIERQLTPNQFAALVSYSYNSGAASLVKYGLASIINSTKSHEDIAYEISWKTLTAGGGVINKGLIRRRLNESRLYMSIPNWYVDTDSPIYKARVKEVMQGKKK
jgi:lysozyme